MSNSGFPPRECGFTLLELMVVLAILGSVMFVTLPKFRALLPSQKSTDAVSQLVQTIETLKRAALVNGRDYQLHVDDSETAVWVTQFGMTLDQKKEARKSALNFNDSIRINGVEFYGETALNHFSFQSSRTTDEIDEIDLQGTYQLFFSREGYSDMALVRLERVNRGDPITLFIQPFLPSVEILYGHESSLSLCN